MLLVVLLAKSPLRIFAELQSCSPVLCLVRQSLPFPHGRSADVGWPHITSQSPVYSRRATIPGLPSTVTTCTVRLAVGLHDYGSPCYP